MRQPLYASSIGRWLHYDQFLKPLVAATNRRIIWEPIERVSLRHDGPITIDPLEIQYGEWVAPAGVSERVQKRPEEFCPSFKLIWPIVAAKVGRT